MAGSISMHSVELLHEVQFLKCNRCLALKQSALCSCGLSIMECFLAKADNNLSGMPQESSAPRKSWIRLFLKSILSLTFYILLRSGEISVAMPSPTSGPPVQAPPSPDGTMSATVENSGIPLVKCVLRWACALPGQLRTLPCSIICLG